MASHRRMYLWNFWPPFLGAGIRIEKVTPDVREIHVRLKKRPWNRNYVGIHYGGSIYSLADPFYMAMLIENLPKDYIVLDKAAEIRFLKPGKTDLKAIFRLEAEEIEKLKAMPPGTKLDWVRNVEIKDTEGQLVASVKKTISVRRKPAPQP